MADSRCKYYKQKKQVSYDNGVTWYDVIPYEYQKGELYEMESQDCGYVPPVTEYRWVKTNDTTCIGEPTPPPTPFKFKYVNSDGADIYLKRCDSSTYITMSETSRTATGVDNGDIYKIEIGDCVKTLHNLCFSEKEYTREVMLSNSVTTIGNSAFTSCFSLTSINIPSGVTSIGNNAFWRCSGLTSITIPDSVTSIGDTAFYRCRSLTSCTIGSGVTSIGTSAFTDCNNLTSVSIIGNGSASIGTYAFKNCSSLRNLTIGSGVTSIGNNAFSYCSGLMSIAMSDSVTTIGEYAFGECNGLTSIIIPDSVTSIGNSAFRDCDNLTIVTMLATTPPTLGALSGPFDSGHINTIYVPCESLNAYRTAEMWSMYSQFMEGIPPCSTSKKLTATYNASSYRTREVECNGDGTLTTSETKPSGYDYELMTSAVIGNCVTSISNSGFRECTSLVKITIPDSVITISDSAFYHCRRLTSIVIPNSVTTIGSYVFYNCTGLTSVTIEATTPPTLGNNVFYGTNNCPIYVPSQSVDAYKAATNWSKYASRIQPIT